MGLTGTTDGRRPLSPQEAAVLRVVEQVIALAGPGNAAERAKLLAPDFTLHRLGMSNLAEMAGVPNASGEAHPGYGADSFADRRDVIQDYLVSGDTAWVVFRLTGHHTGPFWGRPRSGRPLDLLEFGAFRVEGGQVAEAWFMNDELAICRQLGIPVALSELGATIA